MQDRAQLSSRILQSVVSLKYSILKQQVLKLAKQEGQLYKGAGEVKSTTLSESSIKFLALLNLQNSKTFSWFSANSSQFKQPKIIRRVLQKTNLYLSNNIKKFEAPFSAIFPIQILNQQYFVLVLPYKEGNSFLWTLAVLPKLSFISWLPLQQSKGPFSLLNSSSDIISHANYSYITKKMAAPWAIKQNQLGLLEGYHFDYKNSDFVFQVFSKIEGSSLLLSSSWKMYFWPLFFQLLVIFAGIFVLLPYLFFSLFSNKVKSSKVKDFSAKKENPKSNWKNADQGLVLPKEDLALLEEQQELISLQELPAHSSIIKDLKSLIDDLDKKPLNRVNLDAQSSLSEKEQEQEQGRGL